MPPSRRDTKKSQKKKKESTVANPLRHRIPIWIDGQGKIEVSVPRGIPGKYYGEILNIDYLDQKIGEKHRKYKILIVVGDKRKITGFGYGRSKSISKAIKNAAANAIMTNFIVPRNRGTVQEEFVAYIRGTKVSISPAKPGTGIVAPSSVKSLLKLAGVTDVEVIMEGRVNIDDFTLLSEIAKLFRSRSSAGQPAGKRPTRGNPPLRNQRMSRRRLAPTISRRKRTDE